MLNKENLSQNRTALSLAALLFFWPSVNQLIKEWHISISPEDIDFIQWYVRLWNRIILTSIISVIVWLISFWAWSQIISISYDISVILTLFLIWFWIIKILSNQEIIHEDNKVIQWKELNISPSTILFAYTPFINFFYRFKNHNIEKPYRWIKESIIYWSLFYIIWLFFTNWYVLSVLIIIGIVRVTSLSRWYDFITDNFKIKVNKLFTYQIEELIINIVALIYFWYKKIKNNQTTFKECLDYLLLDYTNLAQNNYKELAFENFILTFIIFYISYYIRLTSSFDINLFMKLIPSMLILSKISWSYIYEKPLPVPLIHEIAQTIKYLFTKKQ